eukprot:CAMPEP_0117502316 /NCGR_PEP_ID=MMETSP0784-20121206/23750_1 /TAXON_ID=39447 /ORGANISM="" /LENGTH=280 /DNA_ID=CAMNT_0005297595 /DNA_START=208 /DNA_END=1049 /DNA_ORIENTATION=-
MKYAKPRKPVVPQMGGGCFLEDEMAQVQAVCCLRSPKGAQSSGVLVRFTKDGMQHTAVLTCHHVMPSSNASDRHCFFGHPSSPDVVGFLLRAEALIASSKELDYAAVAVEWHDGLPAPLEMTLPRRRVFAGCALRMVGFGRNMPLRCMYGIVSGTKRNRFYSTSAHEPGMSGAPLFVDGEFVGIHTGYLESTDEASHTYIGAILSDIHRGSGNGKDVEEVELGLLEQMANMNDDEILDPVSRWHAVLNVSNEASRPYSGAWSSDVQPSGVSAPKATVASP